MRKNIRFLFALLTLLLILCTAFSFSHPGRTDSKGGHYDRSNGSYHYHHGYPAHQHPGGVCPYVDPVIKITPAPESTHINVGRTPYNYKYDRPETRENEPIIPESVLPIYLIALVFAIFYSVLCLLTEEIIADNRLLQNLNIAKHITVGILIALVIPAIILDEWLQLLEYTLCASVVTYGLKQLILFIYKLYKGK
mgnify:CR=1 FL=1